MTATVYILMGSESDAEVMGRAVETLQDLSVPTEVRVVSAHRTPNLLPRLVREAERKGAGAFICGAGLAAHLAGAVAARTLLPVLGVPLSSGALQGVDALLSTVQMPPGIPVATFGIGSPGAINAALFAAMILARDDPALAARLAKRRKAAAARVAAASRRVRREFGKTS